jgi:hypothetical protein
MRFSCAESIAFCAEEETCAVGGLGERQKMSKEFDNNANSIAPGLNMTEKDMLKALLNTKQAELIKLENSENPPPLLLSAPLQTYPIRPTRVRQGRGSGQEATLPHSVIDILLALVLSESGDFDEVISCRHRCCRKANAPHRRQRRNESCAKITPAPRLSSRKKCKGTRRA